MLSRSGRQVRYEWATTGQLITTLLNPPAFTGGRDAGIGDVCLSRSRALNHIFPNSATSGDTTGGTTIAPLGIPRVGELGANSA
ncbi:hypothetical protein Tco_1081896 [Tanacetum coccineum]|uniref:Uncharacterized protein n=1 Tax=Tanacetum coccineum TaxID=301880 RepID=A0ABQ5HYV6_9ASTR